MSFFLDHSLTGTCVRLFDIVRGTVDLRQRQTVAFTLGVHTESEGRDQVTAPLKNSPITFCAVAPSDSKQSAFLFVKHLKATIRMFEDEKEWLILPLLAVACAHSRESPTSRLTVHASDDPMAAIDGLIDCCGHSVERADPDLDAEVARFLELEFFAHANTNDDSDNDGAAFQTSSSAAGKTNNALFAKEEGDDVGFLDLVGSFDLPDLEFSGVGEHSLNGSVQLGGNNEAMPNVTATHNLQSASSLLVQIPASALSLPPLLKTTATETGSPVKQIKKVRKRVKDEIEYLRQQVVDFEEKLEQLQQTASRAEAEESVAQQTVDALSSRQGQFASQAASWEPVARRQENEKEKSQAENAKLREKLNKQLSLARSLSNLIQSQQDVSVSAHRDHLLLQHSHIFLANSAIMVLYGNLKWMEEPSEGRASKKLCTTPDGDESVFETLAAAVDNLYCELIAAATYEGGDSGRHFELEPGVKSDANGNVFIEYANCSTLPFDFRTVASVMWKITSTTSMNLGNRQYQALSATENTTRARLTTKLRLRHQDKLVEMSCVGKRFVTEDRVAIVWAMMNATQDGYLLLNGKDRVRVRESGWIILKGAAGTTRPGTDRSQPGTIIQSISRLMPVLERSGDDSAAASVSDHVGMLTDVVLGLYHQNLSFLRQMTENSILNDEVSRQSC